MPEEKKERRKRLYHWGRSPLWKEHKAHPLYRTLTNILLKCTYEGHAQYHLFGGRGVECLFEKFEDFVAELGPRPHEKAQCMRKDENGHFGPGNVYWYTGARTAGVMRRLAREEAKKIKLAEQEKLKQLRAEKMKEKEAKNAGKSQKN